MDFGTLTIVNDELLIVKLSGLFDSKALQELASALNKMEAASAYSKRLVYVDDSLTSAINSSDAMYYKSQRQEPKASVQSAFCVFNDFQYGMARMFQALLEGERHKIEIFRDRESAAKWLDIDIAVLHKQSA